MQQSHIFLSKFLQPDNLQWSTYYGGQIDNPNFGPRPIETGHDIACDNNGNVYVVGRTSARDFPLFVSGNYNNSTQNQGDWYSRGVILKMSQDIGSVLWSSFFGDSECQIDAVTSIKAFDDGSIVIGGFSIDWSFQAPQQSAFPIVTPNGAFIQNRGISYISVLSNSNQIMWSTKLGDKMTNQFYVSTVNDISIDKDNNVYLIGTISEDDINDNIPIGQSNGLIYGGNVDAYVMKFNSYYELSYSFFLGGGGFDTGNSIICVSDGFFVTGATNSVNFPVFVYGNQNDVLVNDVVLNGFDLFVGKFSLDGDQIWMRYLGGDGIDLQTRAQALCNSACNTGGSSTVDESENIYIVGMASDNYLTVPSNNPDNNIYYYPFINGYAQSGGNANGHDAFLTIIDGKSYNIIFSTYWGGDNIGSLSYDESFSVSTYSSAEAIVVYFTGTTNSVYPTIPLCYESSNPYFQNSFAGITDGFQSKIYFSFPTVSNKENRQNCQVKTYPNPTSGMINILMSGYSDLDFCNIQITDLSGKIIISNELLVKNKYTVVDISHLPSGYYILSIISKHDAIVTKIIKI